MSELQDELQSTLGHTYSFERELGGGGMSRVFLARDRSLGRSIVVKVLPAEAAGVPIERFKREIALAAKLQHAHIVPLLAAGELGGLPYYTMPYVEGESLRARLSRGETFAIAEVVSILKDVARALAYAHANGVVHRDIKPDNVLISGGAAVVTDFGIAKAIAGARSEDADRPDATALTQTGVAIGTPAYMSPEQVSADPFADPRTDIYSFGCLAHELLTGVAPFAGSSRQVHVAHISELPEPVERRRPDCPPPLAQLTMRCLEKDPARRPQSATDLLQALDDAATRAGALPRGALVLTAALSIAVVLLGVYFIERARAGATVEKRIAVVPFTNVGGDSAQQYFVDGISDELTTALGRVPGVRAAARSLAYRYRGQRDLDARAVGRTLDVAYLLQGAVRRAGGRVRISAQLTSTKDGSELWADEIERDASDVFAAQDDITQAITAMLQPRFAANGRPRPSEGKTASPGQGTSNAEAYDLYLRGRYLLDRRGAGVKASIDNFQQAIVDDPGFGRAYAGLSFALELMPYFGDIPAPEVRARAWDAAQRALAIDSTLAEARAGLGLLYEHEYNWGPALDQMHRAVRYAPSDAGVRIQYGRTLMYVGDFRAARIQFDTARKLDPYSAVASAWLATALSVSGQPDSAVFELRRAIQIDSSNLVVYGSAQLFAEAGRPDEARALARRIPKAREFYKGYTLGRIGDRAEALAVLRDLESQRPRPWMGEWAIALTAMGLGDTARALSALERATDAREIWPSYAALIEPIYDPVRASPRFAALIRRVGLNATLLTVPRAGRPK